MPLNIQPIEHFDAASGEVLDVHSIFHTIQGEGPFTGRSALFIRLAGCNLQCPACDTDYTSGRRRLHITEIVQTLHALIVRKAARPLVVITGGEPFRQNLLTLCSALLREGYTVQIETNGTLPPQNTAFQELCSTDLNQSNRVFIVCSPKTGKVNFLLARLICAYKYVIDADSVHKDDGLPILALDHRAYPHVARPPSGFEGRIYIQPADRQDATVNLRNLQAVVGLTMNAPNTLTLQLQTHKILNLE